MYETSRSQQATPLGDGDRMMALPPFSALMMLLAGVAAGLVEGDDRPDQADRPHDGRDTGLGVIGHDTEGPGVADVAKQAEGLPVVLGDLVLDIAKAGNLHRHLGQGPVSPRLHDGPPGGQGRPVVTLLAAVPLVFLLRGTGFGNEAVNQQSFFVNVHSPPSQAGMTHARHSPRRTPSDRLSWAFPLFPIRG